MSTTNAEAGAAPVFRILSPARAVDGTDGRCDAQR
jgi:hypothetical protein